MPERTLRIVNRSSYKVDKEAMRLIARQHGNFRPTILVFDWDPDIHGECLAEFIPYRGERGGATGRGIVFNRHGEIRIFLNSPDSNHHLWYFSHEYRHCMQRCDADLYKAIFNTDREKLVRKLCGKDSFDADAYWEWHDVLPEEVDANCFATEVSGRARLSAGVDQVNNPSFPEYDEY